MFLKLLNFRRFKWLILSQLILTFNVIADEALLIKGKDIFRNGLSSNGSPITAIVAGDVPVQGKQFSCENCHGRSGMGATEGTYVVPAITGDFLFTNKNQTNKPTYNLERLKKALVDGVNSVNKELDRLMPRYLLSDYDVKALAAYLKHLSNKEQPGIDSQTIRLATVITEDIDPKIRKAILNVLKKFVEEKNRQTRLESKRPLRGTKPEIQLPSLFRKWKLDVWTLKGASETWTKQLEQYHLENPVFAMFGGLSGSIWSPIARFCEDRQLPCLFPSTKSPDWKKGDWYSIHFSQGVALEAQVIAEHSTNDSTQNIIQIYCSNIATQAANYLSRLITERAKKVRDISFKCNAPLPIKKIKESLSNYPNAKLVLWLEEKHIKILEKNIAIKNAYISSEILDQKIENIFTRSTENVFAVYLNRLPSQFDSAMTRFKVWARIRGIELTYPKLQAEAFFASFATNDALEHIRRYRIQDYLLEMLDHSEGLPLYLPIYPKASIGPGQRFLAKGGYIVPIVSQKANFKEAIWLQP